MQGSSVDMPDPDGPITATIRAGSNDLGGLDGARRDRWGRVRYTVARVNSYSASSRHIPYNESRRQSVTTQTKRRATYGSPTFGRCGR
jgi:hypothetical protein